MALFDYSHLLEILSLSFLVSFTHFFCIITYLVGLAPPFTSCIKVKLYLVLPIYFSDSGFGKESALRHDPGQESSVTHYCCLLSTKQEEKC